MAAVRPTEPPDLPPPDELEPLPALSPRSEHECVRGADVELTGTQLPGLVIRSALLSKLHAGRTRWRDLRLSDARLTACDFANADWLGATLRRVEIADSRLTGANLSESALSDVRFTDCKCDSATFVNTKFQRCRFERCDLRSASFQDADLAGTIFVDCDLRVVRFMGARMKGADLRGSALDGVEASANDVRGVTIDPAQAAELIALLGVKVAPRELS